MSQTKSGCRSSLILVLGSHSHSWVAKGGIASGSDSVQPGFAGPDADRFLDVGDEDFAVADAPGLRRAADRVDRLLDQVLADHDLDFYLGEKVDDVFCTAIELRVTLLPSKPLGLGDGDALQSDLLERLFHLVELEWFDDGFDFFHLSASRTFPELESRWFDARGAVRSILTSGTSRRNVADHSHLGWPSE